MVSPTGLHGQPSGPGTFLPPSDETTSAAPPSLFLPNITSIQHTGAGNDGGNPHLQEHNRSVDKVSALRGSIDTRESITNFIHLS